MSKNKGLSAFSVPFALFSLFRFQVSALNLHFTHYHVVTLMQVELFKYFKSEDLGQGFPY
jgi:hypothetical protein